jgi:hypothetical protein
MNPDKPLIVFFFLSFVLVLALASVGIATHYELIDLDIPYLGGQQHER